MMERYARRHHGGRSLRLHDLEALTLWRPGKRTVSILVQHEMQTVVKTSGSYVKWDNVCDVRVFSCSTLGLIASSCGDVVMGIC